jgi:archaellum component FlaC
MQVTQRLQHLEKRLGQVENGQQQLGDTQNELTQYLEDLENQIDHVRSGVDANARALVILQTAQRDPIKTFATIACVSFILYLFVRVHLSQTSHPL